MKKRCAEPDCVTLLSIYQNQSERYCYAHQLPDPRNGAGYIPGRPGPKPKGNPDPVYRACPTCRRFMPEEGCWYCSQQETG